MSVPITGIDFKKKYHDIKFYKLTNKTENHNGFQFKDGINIDVIPFNLTKNCLAGGLYFTELNKIGIWTTYINITYIREVEILDDSLICIEKNACKANKFILKEKIKLCDFVFWKNFKFCKLAVTLNGFALQYVNEILCTKELCELAVIQNGLSLQYVNKSLRTDELCKLAIQQNCKASDYVIKKN